MAKKRFTEKAWKDDSNLEDLAFITGSVEETLETDSYSAETKIDFTEKKPLESKTSNYDFKTAYDLVSKKAKPKKIGAVSEKTNSLNFIALGSYTTLKGIIEDDEFELSVSQLSEKLGLSRSTIKKHKEIWLANNWIRPLESFDCAHQSPGKFRCTK